MKKKLVPLSSVIETVFTQSSSSFLEISFLFQLRNSWEKIVGKSFYHKSWPIRFKNKELLISLTDSTYVQEMHFVKDTLRKKINQQFPIYKVKKINLLLNQ